MSPVSTRCLLANSVELLKRIRLGSLNYVRPIQSDYQTSKAAQPTEAKELNKEELEKLCHLRYGSLNPVPALLDLDKRLGMLNGKYAKQKDLLNKLQKLSQEKSQAREHGELEKSMHDELCDINAELLVSDVAAAHSCAVILGVLNMVNSRFVKEEDGPNIKSVIGEFHTKFWKRLVREREEHFLKFLTKEELSEEHLIFGMWLETHEDGCPMVEVFLCGNCLYLKGDSGPYKDKHTRLLQALCELLPIRYEVYREK